MSALVKASLAELIGTFALVFVGMAAVTVAPVQSVLVPALAYGLVVMGLVFALGPISGGQFNPAVTLALVVGGKENPMRGLTFIVVQLIASAVAAFVFLNMIPEQFQVVAEEGVNWNEGLAIGVMTTTGGMWWSATLEGIQTFLFVTVIFQAAVYGRAGNLAPLAIGFTLVALAAAFGVYTGTSVNPARTLGPALVAGSMNHVVPYLVGIFSGGALAGVFNGYVLTPDKKA